MICASLISALYAICLITTPSSSAELRKGIYSMKLGDHWLFWNYDFNGKWVKFQLQGRFHHDDWFALGFSDRGDMQNADYCIFFRNNVGQRAIVDAWTDDKCLLGIDFQQDCQDFHYETKNNVTRLVFIKTFDSCKEHDYLIEEGTTHIVWTRGSGPLRVKQNLCNEQEGGMVRTTLLRVDINTDLEPEAWNFTATVDKLNVPEEATTYWCQMFRLPQRIAHAKHHLIGFEPVIEKGHEHLVHHMELFHCETPSSGVLPGYSGPCEDRPLPVHACKKVLAAWAMGASPFHYPQKAGLPVGGYGYSTYVLLEIHYNNVEERKDYIDSSGIRVFLTSRLRKFDAGVIELGLEYTDKISIPPKQEKFQVDGYCIEDCTQVGVPNQGIWIFASQLHTHLTGVKVETVLVKKGVETQRVDWDNHYSPHYQEIRLLRHKVLVLPGNALVTRCTYNTMERDNITLGGFSTSDEMCVNYVYYYPKVDLEVCKSSISDEALGRYFNRMKLLENQNTGPYLPISESYKNIEWTPLRVHILDELYHQSDIYMQCNRSNGDRFPGSWIHMPLTRIRSFLPPSETCSFNQEIV